MRFDKDLVAASSTPIILSILESTEHEGGSYGYAIIKEVERLSNNEMNWTEGMLYPVLHRLEAQHFVDSFWKTAPETGKRRKYYRITPRGIEELSRLKTQWRFVDRVLKTTWDDEPSECVVTDLPNFRTLGRVVLSFLSRTISRTTNYHVISPATT